MALEGVRIGPLDPDRGESFGQVGSNVSARALIRHHIAMHPAALVGALGRKRQEPRSLAIDLDEAAEAAKAFYEDAGEPLPDGAVLSGFNVRGADDKPSQQVLTFTWAVPVEEGGSGRSGKGFMPYSADTLPKSYAAGSERTRIEELKKAGLPYTPSALVEAAQIAGVAAPAVSQRTGDEAADDLIDEAEEAREAAETRAKNAEARAEQAEADAQAAEERFAALERRLAEVEAQRAPEDADTTTVAPPSGQTAEGGSAEGAAAAASQPTIPYDGYDDANADKIRARLREADDPQLAQRVLDYETAQGGANRSTVVAQANDILDRHKGDGGA